MKRLLVMLIVVVTACGSPAKTATPKIEPTPGPAPGPAPVAEKTLVLVDDKGVGLGGHDPVSYTKGAPIAGSATHASTHGGATYHFANAEDKTAFDADKPKFAPGYGGYCAYAASLNRLSSSDPKVFHLHEGHLLVFTNEDYKKKFMADPAGNKTKADANWPGLVSKHGK